MVIQAEQLVKRPRGGLLAELLEVLQGVLQVAPLEALQEAPLVALSPNLIHPSCLLDTPGTLTSKSLPLISQTLNY